MIIKGGRDPGLILGPYSPAVKRVPLLHAHGISALAGGEGARAAQGGGRRGAIYTIDLQLLSCITSEQSDVQSDLFLTLATTRATNRNWHAPQPIRTAHTLRPRLPSGLSAKSSHADHSLAASSDRSWPRRPTASDFATAPLTATRSSRM